VRVLITGVSGFVGGHLVERLRALQPEAELFGLVKPHGVVRGDVPAGVTCLEADLDDAAGVAAAVLDARPDRVIHLAGQSSVQHSWMNPGGTLGTNVLGLVHLVEALLAHALRPRLLVVGSADEYGAVDPAELPIREERALRPRSPYAVSKAAQGLLAREYAGHAGLWVVCTRTFPHTGPRRGEAFAESSFARQLAEIEADRREPVLRVGNLDAVRDFSDVRDVVRAYWSLLGHGVSGQAYNVCSGTGVSIRQLLDRLIELSGVRVEVRVDPERLRPVDIPALVGHPGKLREATGWCPQLPLDQTLRDLLGYWRERVRSAAMSAAPQAER
jgi:GDP-4-dehydro-6-deoxy-D-mannose reductase